MSTRRDLIKTVAAAGVATAILGVKNIMAATTQLTWKHFPAGENGFFRAPVLISGASEAVLIDGGFTLPDGRALAEAIKASGKKLTTIYISQSDPDYYFSLAPIKAAFPEAKVIAASATIAAIKGNVEKKLATWGPQLKENGPQTLADIVMPEAFDGRSLTLEGQTIEMVDADGLANRRYLWVPSLNAIFGGVLVFSGRSRVDRRYPGRRGPRGLGQDARRHGSPQAGRGRARPHGARRGDRCQRDPLHPRLSAGLRRRAGQGG
jgi:glyoxylase-like metal-dependent hydrolase (beta-lactamase superfamily II)